MVSLLDLWAPVLASAVLVFIASSVIHMVIKYHASDYNGFSNEDEIRAAIRKGGATPKQYVIPRAAEMKDMCSPEMVAKFKEGPVATIWIGRHGNPAIGGSLIKWFLFSVAISAIAGYLASATLPSDAAYLSVFRVAGTVALLGYAGHGWSDVIWKMKPASCAVKETIDGVIYAVLTAGAFGWLWPR